VAIASPCCFIHYPDAHFSSIIIIDSSKLPRYIYQRFLLHSPSLRYSHFAHLPQNYRYTERSQILKQEGKAEISFLCTVMINHLLGTNKHRELQNLCYHCLTKLLLFYVIRTLSCPMVTDVNKPWFETSKLKKDSSTKNHDFLYFCFYYDLHLCCFKLL